ncbi:putative Ig domain-containing protein [Pyxidicoccus trucidator]|uniref:putative Ig domain-containing protein n=1 Tax=Pyxidicoccus trucidator TaxID=2709662 RepID=UPI0013D9E3A1|nr:putative Ig domain-containing protein [Pyxidicoccus trucidator]
MSSPRALAPLFVLLLLTACSDPTPTPDPVDSGVTTDAGPGADSGTDAGTDAGTDPGTDAGTDAGSDAGTDAGSDAGPGAHLNLNTQALPDAYVGRPYSAPLLATGGVPPYTWALTEGALPTGLTLTAEGVLTGTPSETTAASFNITVGDTTGVRVTAPLALTPYALPTLAEVPAPTREVGDDVSATLTVTGGKAPFTFTSGTLPPGLTLASGVLQGTLSQAGTFTFDLTATDANGVTATRSVTFIVLERFAITTGALPQGTRGEPYTFTLTASGGRAPLSWSVTAGTLPSGLSLSSAGVLSGAPASAGTSTFTVTLQDADAQTDLRELSLTVRDPGAPVFTVGQFNITYFGDNTRGPANSSSDGGTSDDRQIAYARDVMRDAGANVWGMVEMVDTADFEVLKSQLPGFNGFLSNNASFITGGTSPYGNSSQKLGVLYDTSLTFKSAKLILNDAANLPDFSNRPPLLVEFTTEIQGVETPLTVIVVHMRAESADPTGPRDARQRASAALKAYLDQNLPTQHVFVVGDWNDDVDESITLDPGSGAPLPTPYQDFVSDAERYTFITRELSLAGDDTSIGFENMVDHTLASNEAAARYVAGSARVIYADNWVPDYLNTLSDHRPATSAYAFSAETGPFLRLKSPQGGAYQAGTPLTITWKSFGVEQVRVETSINDGANWDVLAASVPAATGSHSWMLPDIDSTTVRVRVVDASNQNRSDMSDAALTLIRGPGRVFINEVLAHEPLVNGSLNQAYEFVEIVNASPFEVDISGWGLWDSSNNVVRHVFPAGTRMGAGKGYVVFGGAAGIPAGLTNAAAASSNQNTLGLSNSTDAVRLRMPNAGSEVSRYDYTSTVQNVSVNRASDGNPDASFIPHTEFPSGLTSSPGKRADGTDY